MSNLVTPLLRVENTPTGSTLINCRMEHGALEAEISAEDRHSLNIAYAQTDANHLRQGIASTLITSTTREVYEVEERKLLSVKFQIINPVMVPLLGKIFDESVEWYAEQEDCDTESNGIDMLTAQTLAVSREEQAEEFRIAREEFPDDFDPGVYAVAALEPTQMAQWVMPSIVFVDRLY